MHELTIYRLTDSHGTTEVVVNTTEEITGLKDKIGKPVFRFADSDWSITHWARYYGIKCEVHILNLDLDKQVVMEWTVGGS